MFAASIRISDKQRGTPARGIVAEKNEALSVRRETDARIDVAGDQLRSAAQNRDLVEKSQAGVRLFNPVEVHVVSIRRKGQAGIVPVARGEYLRVTASDDVPDPEALLP